MNGSLKPPMDLSLIDALKIVVVLTLSGYIIYCIIGSKDTGDHL